MTREEATAALLQGATSTNCEYLTVKREHLVLALSEPTKDKKTNVGKPTGDVQGRAG